jgi:hypothetical protein
VILGPVSIEVPVRLRELRALGYEVDINTHELETSIRVHKDGLRIQYVVGLWDYQEWLNGHDVLGHIVGTTGRPRGMRHDAYNTHMRVIGITTDNTVPDDQLEAYRQLLELGASQHSQTHTWSSSKIELYPVEDHQTESPSANPPEVPRFKPGRIIDLE